MGFFKAILGFVAQDPISAGFSKAAETIGERVANIFLDKLPDGSKKHFENAAKIAADSCTYDVLPDKPFIVKALLKAYGEFVDQSNITMKMIAFIQTVNTIFAEKLNDENYAEKLTDVYCSAVYTSIMQEDDANGGDKLKAQFKAAREAYIDAKLESVKIAVDSSDKATLNEFDDVFGYNQILIIYKSEKVLPSDFELKVDEDIDFRPCYFSYYQCNRLGNTIVVSLSDGDYVSGEDANDVFDYFASWLTKFGIDKDTIAVYAEYNEEVVF